MNDAHNPDFTGHNLDQLAVPVLISVPHAGRHYPSELFPNLRSPAENLVRLEDRYADLLARDAIDAKIPAIIASKARAWIDLNRDARDIDAGMVDGLDSAGLLAPSAKQRGGLGLIPRRLAGVGEIWKRPITLASAQHRIESYHRPYHHAISETLRKMRDRFGIAILLDLHSMPPLPDSPNAPAAQFIIGDRFGRSAHGVYSETLLTRIRQDGFLAALNQPYSGDYILRAHGDVNANIHALQLEVDRSMYLDRMLREPSLQLPLIAQRITDWAFALAEQGNSSTFAQAAE
jgi:N-formylglutamate amidohydrolase